jgi:hypothetical protein
MTVLVQEYFVPEDKTPQYIILAILILLLVGFWAIIFIFSERNGDSNVKAYETCQIGYCPTNKYTGEKRCPVNNSIGLQYDPEFEVCNPSNGCVDVATPYAMQSDGSTNVSGECDIDKCRCVNFLSTPSYIEVIFNMENGNLYSTQPETQNRTILSQQASRYLGEGNNVPIVYNSSITQFWQFAPSLLSRVVPSPCSDIFEAGPEVDNLDLLQCINRNPCIAGKLAYLPTNSTSYNNFTEADIQGGYGVGCVPNSVENSPLNDNTCNSDNVNLYYYAPVFNPSSGFVHCFQFPVS